MPQTFADDGQFGVLAISQGGPAMAGYVRGEFTPDTCLLPEPFQYLIIIAEFVLVLSIGFVGIGMGQYGKYIVGIAGLVAADDFLGVREEADANLFIGFPTMVGQVAVFAYLGFT